MELERESAGFALLKQATSISFYPT